MAPARIQGSGLSMASAVWRRRVVTPATANSMSTSASAPRQMSLTNRRTAQRVPTMMAPTARRDHKSVSIDTQNRYASTQAPSTGYTASDAFFEGLWEAGITHCFVNLGSDHPSIIEAMVKGNREAKDRFPRIITCPNEVNPTLAKWFLLTEANQF